MQEKPKIYRPFLFIAIAFSITWVCAVFLAYQTWFRYETGSGKLILWAADFMKSASPTIAALILWRKPLFKERRIFRFLLGKKPGLWAGATVIFLFALQFLTFFIFRQPGGAISMSSFFTIWAGQIMFGGGMEEGGWRGYLQPALERDVPVILSVILVGIVWAAWHLPYFFLPGNFFGGGGFLMYAVIATATAFTLTAIYKLTGSILLCILFHSWQNAIVMAVPANMGHPGFLAMFGAQTLISIILCLVNTPSAPK